MQTSDVEYDMEVNTTDPYWANRYVTSGVAGFPIPEPGFFWDAVDMFLGEIRDMAKWIRRTMADDAEAIANDWALAFTRAGFNWTAAIPNSPERAFVKRIGLSQGHTL